MKFVNIWVFVCARLLRWKRSRTPFWRKWRDVWQVGRQLYLSKWGRITL